MIRNRLGKFWHNPPASPPGFDYRPQEQPQAPVGGISRMDGLEREDGSVRAFVARYMGYALDGLAVAAGLLCMAWLIGYFAALGVKAGLGV